MHDIRIIALDLDGTLLNSDKQLTSRNLAALQRAAETGIEIVPTTGRFHGGMPKSIRDLLFVHYAITINGAQVFDIQKNRAIVRTEIPLEQAIEIMTYLDEYPVIYDCYMDNWGWMTREMWEQAETFAPNEHYLKMIKELRTPVDELKAHLKTIGYDVQKIQVFVQDMKLHGKLMEQLAVQFPQTAISSSVGNNIEINAKNANKGAALRKLAEYLSCDISQTVSFGDGLNDLSMIEQAGIGVAMANACSAVLAVADRITKSCDEDGVAAAIEEILK